VFSTVLKEITGYFDRRVLVSTFFPSLVFLGGTLLLVLLIEVGRAELLAGWNRQPGTVQAIMVAGLLILVGFWTFVLVNLREVLDRLYQGYWSGIGLAAAVAKRWRTSFERRRAELVRQDRELEYRAEQVQDERAAFPTPEEIIAAPQASALAGGIGVAVDHALDDLERRLDTVEQTDLAMATPSGLAEKLRAAWRLAKPHVQDADPADGTPWGSRLGRLNQATDRLRMTLDRLDQELQEQRLRLHRELFLSYPLVPETVMPTALGNVMKSAERYSWQRYRLDAVVIWSRLQPLLPSEFADLLQQAKTSLDLLLTLTTFTWLFGVPLALWTALRAAWPASSPMVTVLAALALAGCILPLVGRHTRRPARLAGATVLVVAVATLVVAQLSGAGPARTVTVRAGVFLLLVTGIALLAWALYRNAVQAGLGYGEQLKAAFDLHRWRVLDQLHLRTPPNLTEERVIWEQLSTMLYRGTPPDPEYYQYTVQDQAKPPVTPTTRLWVPARNLPAYRPVAAEDLEPAELPAAEIPVDAAREREDLAGRRPLVPLSVGRPVPSRVMVDSGHLDGTAALVVAVTAAGAFEGTVGVGDLIDLLVMRRSALRCDHLAAVFEDLLVLAITPALHPDDPLHLLVALPVVQRLSFAAATRRGTVLLSRKVSAG
jgi:hypothetical protein